MSMSWLSPSGSAVAESHHHGEGLQPKLCPGRQAGSAALPFTCCQWHMANGCGEDGQRAAVQTPTTSAGSSQAFGALADLCRAAGRSQRRRHLTAAGRSGGFSLKSLVHPLVAAHWLSIPSALDPDPG